MRKTGPALGSHVGTLGVFKRFYIRSTVGCQTSYNVGQKHVTQQLHMYTCSDMFLHTHIYVYTQMYTCIYIYTQRYNICMYIHTHIYTVAEAVRRPK